MEAFLNAVCWVVNNNYQDNWIVFHSDSQLVVTALHKNYIKNKQYINLFKSISRMLDDLAFYEIKWIPEKENKGADNMAKQALAKQRKSRKRVYILAFYFFYNNSFLNSFGSFGDK